MQSLERLETTQVPVTSDPQKFISEYLQSSFYKEGYDQFYEGKNLVPEVTEEMKTKLYQNSEISRINLVQFAEKSLHYTLNSDVYPPEVQEAIQGYLDAAGQLDDALKSYDQDEIINMESMRRSAHQTLADRLFENKIVPSTKLGIGLAGLIAIDKGFETYDHAKKSRTRLTEQSI